MRTVRPAVRFHYKKGTAVNFLKHRADEPLWSLSIGVDLDKLGVSGGRRGADGG